MSSPIHKGHDDLKWSPPSFSKGVTLRNYLSQTNKYLILIIRLIINDWGFRPFNAHAPHLKTRADNSHATPIVQNW